MVEITMYGQPTSNYEFVKMMLKKKVSKVGVELKINEISDWTKIVENKVQSLPTITVNDHISMSYTDDQNINKFIEDLTTKILKEENYGNMKKIIVPTDFSYNATNALIYAKGISKELKGVVQLLHVYKPEPIVVDSVVIINNELENTRRKRLEDFVKSINKSWAVDAKDDLPIDASFKVGFVAEELSQMCKDVEDECLVVVGSTGNSGALKKIFGSVSTTLAKTSKSPVLIIPPDATYNTVTDILYAVDDIEKDLKGLSKVLEYASLLHANVHLVHVKDDDNIYPEHEMITIAKDMYPDVKVYFASIDGPDVTAALNDYAATNTIDIVSVVTHERGFFADLFHKSVTKKMAINTEVPLLILHA